MSDTDESMAEAMREVMGAAVEMTTWMLSEFGDDIVAVPGFERWRSADAAARGLLMRVAPSGRTAPVEEQPRG